MFHVWFIALYWPWPVLLLALVVIPLVLAYFVPDAPTLVRCAIGVLLVLGVHLDMRWWAYVIFWIAFAGGVVGALIGLRYDDPARPWHPRLPKWIRICGYLALGIPLIALGLLVFHHFFKFSIHIHLYWWVWLIVLVVLVLLALKMFKRTPVFAVLAVLVLVVAIILIVSVVQQDSSNTPSAGSSSSSSAPSSASSSASGSTSGSLTTEQQKQQQAAQASLIVDYTKVNADQANTLVKKYFGASNLVSYTLGHASGETPKFDVGAMHPVGHAANRRLWSDATNVPLKPRTLEAEQATIARDPAQAAMVMNGLGKQKVGGISVYHQNPWMQAQGSPAAIRTWAQHCMTQDVQTHLQCARIMAATVTLVGRFHNAGISKRPTTWNYHLGHGGLAVNKVPSFGLNPKQYDGHFLVLEMTEKTGGCFIRFGFNVGLTSVNGGDQRLAGFSCVPPKAPPSTSPQYTTPGTTPTSTPTTPVHPTSTPTTPVYPTSPPTHPSTTTCPNGEKPFSNGICPVGKHASQAPKPTGGPVITCSAGEHLSRSSNTCVANAAPSSAPSSSSTNQGKGDSGPGATNTTTAPSASATAPAPPKSSSPSSNPPKPPAGG